MAKITDSPAQQGGEASGAVEKKSQVGVSVPEKSEMQRLFAAFDAEDVRISSLPAPADFEESRKRLRMLIDRLPQRLAILDEHVDRWLDRATRNAIDRMEIEKGRNKATIRDVHDHVMWHVRRASAIGGSDAGTVVKHFRGKRGGFSDARSIVMQKLLIMSPMPGTIEMSRGVRGEPWLQKMYREQTGATTIDADLGKLRGYRWAALPSMIGTPDDLAAIPVEGGTRRRVVDYKCPSVDVVTDYEENGLSFDYVCQLHHYGILALAAGVKFDDMSIEAFDYRGFTMKSFPVPFDKALARELTTAHERIWSEFVMPGILPEKLQPDELALEEPEIVDLGYRLAGLKILAKEIDDRAKGVQKSIAAVGGDWHGLSEGTMKMEVASFDRTREWDQEKLLDIATSAGLDRDGYAVKDKAMDADRVTRMMTDLKDNEGDPEGLAEICRVWLQPGAINKVKYDLKRLAADLEDMGINTLSAAGISERFNTTRKKSGPEVERLNSLKNEISGLADGVEGALEDSVGTIRKIAMGIVDEAEDYPDAV